MEEMGCPAITAIEFDNLPVSAQMAMQDLIGEHNAVQEAHRPQSVYDSISKMRARWLQYLASGKVFFDEKGEVSDTDLQDELLKWCGISTWENLKPRLQLACCSELAWRLLEDLRDDWLLGQTNMAEESEKKKKKRKGATPKKIPEFSYTNLYAIFATTMPEAVRISCLGALLKGEIVTKDIRSFCQNFQGKALIANTILDHIR